MATSSSFTPFCTLASRVKGDHVYQANPKINDKCDCFPEPKNQRSPHVIIVKKHSKTGEIIGHVPDALAKVFSTADGQKDFCVLHNHRTIKAST